MHFMPVSRLPVCESHHSAAADQEACRDQNKTYFAHIIHLLWFQVSVTGYLRLLQEEEWQDPQDVTSRLQLYVKDKSNPCQTSFFPGLR